jgi:hypothetical protein
MRNRTARAQFSAVHAALFPADDEL